MNGPALSQTDAQLKGATTETTGTDKERTRPVNPLQGIAWMLVTMFMFSCINATAKSLAQSLPVIEVVWARYFFQMLLLILFLRHRLPKVIATGKLKLQIARSLLLLITTLLFFTGLSKIPMADATSVMFVAPILVTVLSLPILGERVGMRRWIGVLIGFLGAMIIIRPGMGMVQPAILFPLGAACFHSLYQLSTRFLSRTDSTLTTLIYSASTGSIIMTITVPFFWVTPSPSETALMVIIGLFAALGHYCLIKAFEAAPPAIVAPFSYTNLLWATLFGFVLFSDLPDAWTIIGALIIAGSGLYIFHRERTHGDLDTPLEKTI